jgi:exonuclease III
LQRKELERVRQLVQRLAAPGETRVIGGDLNLLQPVVPGYDGAGDGIDHILVAGATAGPLIVWERARRVQNGLVLSDHAPVERLVG